MRKYETQLADRYIGEFLARKVQQKKVTTYNPATEHRDQRMLCLVACHADKPLKVRCINNNLGYLCGFENIVVCVINSEGTEFADAVREECATKGAEYVEVPNEATLDFGKWTWVLRERGCLEGCFFNHVLFTNDSFLIEAPIVHFFNQIFRRNLEMYAYNDSTERGGQHYQSYLFSVRVDALPKLIDHVEENKDRIEGYFDVVDHLEIPLFRRFESSHDCFLPIGRLPGHRGKSVFYTNNGLYKLLKNHGLFPFFKLRRFDMPP